MMGDDSTQSVAALKKMADLSKGLSKARDFPEVILYGAFFRFKPPESGGSSEKCPVKDYAGSI
jgi:hypothetical protein